MPAAGVVGGMRRIVVLGSTAGLVLALADPAAAKGGADRATITGPGLKGGKLVLSARADGPKLRGFLEAVGFYPAVFAQVPSPMRDTRPSWPLGPRYNVVYRVPGSNRANATVLQYVYPYAQDRVVSYLRPGQRLPDGMKTRGGWFVSPLTRQTLVLVGFPASRPRHGHFAGTPAPRGA